MFALPFSMRRITADRNTKIITGTDRQVNTASENDLRANTLFCKKKGQKLSFLTKMMYFALLPAQKHEGLDVMF